MPKKQGLSATLAIVVLIGVLVFSPWSVTVPDFHVQRAQLVGYNLTFYVSPSGNNSTGTSWTDAWTDTTRINWSSVPSGSTILLDGETNYCSVSPYDFSKTAPNPGVTCGTRYSAFTIGTNDVTIERATTPGHDGTVVIDGGRDTPLPYCLQPSYSAAAGAPVGIEFNGHTGVTIDGVNRSGIIVRGAQNGVRMRGGGFDTLRSLEIFDNGYPTTVAGGYNSDGNGVLMGGENDVYDRLLVHDNGQDEMHSDGSGYDESGSTIEYSWMGAERANPAYPGEPFNDLQAEGNTVCTHADGIQIFAPGTTMTGLILNYDLFGPGINQGVSPSDGGTGTTFDSSIIANSLFLDAASHNIISDKAVQGWTLDHDTMFATQGGSEIPSNGTNAMEDTIKDGGYFAANGPWATAGNVWYTGDALPGSSTNSNPMFASAPSGTLPSISTLFTADLTPSCSVCSGTGSPLHRFGDILTVIDGLNGGSSGTSIPVIIWARPKIITYGTKLSDAQLNAKASVPGTFAYNPPLGTLLDAGSHTITATFTPNDTAHYVVRSLSSRIVVRKAATTTTLRFSEPVTYGLETGEVFSVSEASPSGVIPTGKVKVFAGTVQLCIAILDGAGNGSCRLLTNTSLGVGSYAVEADYLTTRDFARSVSTAGSLIVSY